MKQGEASRTAVLVAQGRALANGNLAVGRFSDPIAESLLADNERAALERVRRAPPRGQRTRPPAGQRKKAFLASIEIEMLRSVSEVMVLRTVVIDEAIDEAANPQLVILGAGLDARAWRMPSLRQVDVFEVDHPDSQRDKAARIGAREPIARTLHKVSVDFTRDLLGVALDAAGHAAAQPTTWIWEGVVPYLSPDEVEATLRVVFARSAPKSRIVIAYQAPDLAYDVTHGVAPLLGRLGFDNPFANEPRRSTWTAKQMAALLTRHGLVVRRDDDLGTIAERIGVSVHAKRSARAGRVVIADR